MINLIKYLLFEYCILLMKTTLNVPTILAFTKFNFCLLIDVEALLGLNAIMPFLEAIHSLIKYAQLCDVLVCNFIAIVKVCEREIYQMYCDNLFLLPRWCVWKLLCLYQFYSWKHKIFVDHRFKYRNKSLGFWVSWTTWYLDHICKRDGGV